MIPLWSSGHDTCLLNGKAVVQIRAQRMLLSQKGFKYVTMNPLLPAKAVDCQPAVSRSEMRCLDLGQAT